MMLNSNNSLRYTYDGRDCSRQSCGIHSIPGDNNGSRIGKYDGADVLQEGYSYNQKRFITTISTVGTGNSSFAYDANAYRIEKTNPDNSKNKYLLEAEHLESTLDENDQLKAKYLRGAVIDEIIHGYTYDASQNKTDLTFHHDQVNTVVALTNNNGATIQTMQYGPFGEALGSTGSSANSLQYTGRELDSATNLYYYRARYYDREIGRFLSEDPMGFEAGINFYAYCDNNPVSCNDPTGNDAFFYHGIQAYQAARRMGWGIWESTKFGWNVSRQDGRTPSLTDPSAVIQNLHGTGGRGQSAESRYAGVTEALNDPTTGLSISFDRIPNENEKLWSVTHNAEDIANNGHRNGNYEGLSWNPVSWGEFAYHVSVIDMIQPLFNWGQRVDNAVTAMSAFQNGDKLHFDQDTGAVWAACEYPSQPSQSTITLGPYKKP